MQRFLWVNDFKGLAVAKPCSKIPARNSFGACLTLGSRFQPATGWSFWPFFAGNVVLAILVAPLMNATGGSLLWPALFHWQLINPFWPDAQPYDTWLLAAVALVLLALRPGMFLRRGGNNTTHVLPQPPAG